MSLKRNFIVQQGFVDPPVASCSARYAALQFQPRVVGIAVLACIIFQLGALFFILSMVLFFSAAFPQWNPFEALYNRGKMAQPAAIRLLDAPAPRRFAQGMAASFALAIAGCLQFQELRTAYALEGILVAALVALVFGGFCLGSFTYHLLKGEWRFAIRTLPWITSD